MIFFQPKKLAQTLLNYFTASGEKTGSAKILNQNNKGDVMKMSIDAARPKPARQWLHASLFGLLSGFCASASALDVDAGDYTALPAGTNLGLLYYQHAERNRLYANGDKLPLDAGLDSDIGILRGVHFMELGGYIVDPQFLLPFGNVRAKDDLSALGSDSGTGDLILAATVWLVNQPEQRRYFGITPYLWLPTGSYDNDRAINLGENRWKGALQAGYIEGLGDKFSLDLVGDVTFFGKNDDFGPASQTLKQKPLFQAQAFLRYHVNERFDLRAGVSRLWGGETEVDGLDMDDKPNTSKFNVGASWFFTPRDQLLVNFGRDLSVDNGFKEQGRVNLRLLHVF